MARDMFGNPISVGDRVRLSEEGLMTLSGDLALWCRSNHATVVDVYSRVVTIDCNSVKQYVLSGCVAVDNGSVVKVIVGEYDNVSEEDILAIEKHINGE